MERSGGGSLDLTDDLQVHPLARLETGLEDHIWPFVMGPEDSWRELSRIVFPLRQIPPWFNCRRA